MKSDLNALREEARHAVREIIASIKEINLDEAGILDDTPLFGDGLSEPSPLEMDSLDALDLALALRDRFEADGDRFEDFLNGEVDMQEMGTVNKIVEFMMTVSSQITDGSPAGPRMGAGRANDQQ